MGLVLTQDVLLDDECREAGEAGEVGCALSALQVGWDSGMVQKWGKANSLVIYDIIYMFA